MNNSEPNATTEAMMKVLQAQRDDYLNGGHVSAELRIDRMRRGMNSIYKYQNDIVDALNTDFSCRPRELSLLTDISTSILPFKSAIKQVRKWMKPEKRKSMFPLGLLGGRSRIEFQPWVLLACLALGTFLLILLLVPWPIFLPQVIA